MNRFFFPAFFFVVLCISCKSKTGSNHPRDTSVDSSKETFYPITQYLDSQLTVIDTISSPIEKRVYENNHLIDSATIDRQALRSLAASFLYPDLLESKVRPNYTEAEFNDQTINTLTFSYNATDPDTELQQKDILLNAETQQVKTVLFRKTQHHGDTIITINGLWKPNQNFQLNYLIEPASGPMQTRQVKVIWNKPVQ